MSDDFKPFTIGVDDRRTVTGRFWRAPRDGHLGATLVLAHGAGAGQQSAFMVSFARGLSARGLDVATFDFPYIEAHRRIPDGNAVLEATWRAVIRAVRERPEHEPRRLLIGGKSMGGRIASQVAAQPDLLSHVPDGLVFLGYPLHPPSRPEQRRDVHLSSIAAPMFFVQGERDTFGDATEMRALMARLRDAELFIVEGANHSLQPPKRASARPEGVTAAVQDLIVAWIRRRFPASAAR